MQFICKFHEVGVGACVRVLFFQFMMIYAASNTGFRQERYFLMQSMQRLIQGISVSDTSKRYVAQPSRDLFLTLEEDF